MRELFAMRRHGIRPALQPSRRFLGILGNPQDNYRSLHVAGTNGKGSTTAMIASILKEAGYRTGAYYSPHVTDFRERFLLDGRFFPKREITAALRWMGGKYVAGGNRPEFLTFFEWGTALAFCLFARAGVNAAVLETGMGGNFDATNVVTPEVSIITNVSLEHTAVLGASRKAIAAEKAGIIKRGKPVVCGDMPRPVKDVIRAIAAERKSPAFFLGEDFNITKSGRFTAANGAALTLVPSMAGEYQLKNAAVAAQAALLLSGGADRSVHVSPGGGNRPQPFHITGEHIERGIAKAVLPGRFEIVRAGGREIIFDVAHNPAAMKELAKLLRGKGPEFDFAIGILSDKDYRGMLQTLAPLTRRMYCIAPDGERSIPAKMLRDAARDAGIKAVALSGADGIPPGGRTPLCVTGSFTTVEAVKRALGGK